uniref:Alpha/beta hydrolase n=1 Tax=Picea glauca TaxID=3330 RepID=A0A101LV57_PICGL|nr:hypothetical protein ABT39_MTgene2299 [Picea glauca]
MPGRTTRKTPYGRYVMRGLLGPRASILLMHGSGVCDSWKGAGQQAAASKRCKEFALEL